VAHELANIECPGSPRIAVLGGKMHLLSNSDLYAYLRSLALVLSERGRSDLATRVDFACRHSASSATEFLGESKFALEAVIESGSGILKADEIADLKTAIADIRRALERR
jgi:hypothetical protein